MKRQTDFAYHLSSYLTVYLPATKNFSTNTIHSYRDAFKLFLLYCEKEHHIQPDRIKILMITPDLISGFTGWLRESRNNTVATANQRLAVLHAFFKYVQNRDPQHLLQCQQIRAVALAKTPKPAVVFLSIEQLQLVFAQIDDSTRSGRRDAALLHLLYDSGARVQELCDLKVRDFYFDGNPRVELHGKGDKSRYAPLVSVVAHKIHEYIVENGLDRADNLDMPMFFNRQRQKLTRAGVSYIVSKYAAMARTQSPLIPAKVTPHIFRHTKAMHLCQAGIDIIYIRDILGHTDLATTEIYARMNLEHLQDALENAYPELPSQGLPDWHENGALMQLLNCL